MDQVDDFLPTLLLGKVSLINNTHKVKAHWTGQGQVTQCEGKIGHDTIDLFDSLG
jgi:hypothetical protein